MRNYLDPKKELNLGEMGKELIIDGWRDGGTYNNLKTGALFLIAEALRGGATEDKIKNTKAIHLESKNITDDAIQKISKSNFKGVVYGNENTSTLFSNDHLKLNNTFENTYVRELSIMSHAHEILELYRETLITCDEKEKDELFKKYRNQCVDLMLILISEYDSDPERITARVAKFQEKGELDDHN